MKLTSQEFKQLLKTDFLNNITEKLVLEISPDVTDKKYALQPDREVPEAERLHKEALTQEEEQHKPPTINRRKQIFNYVAFNQPRTEKKEVFIRTLTSDELTNLLEDLLAARRYATTIVYRYINKCSRREALEWYKNEILKR